MATSQIWVRGGSVDKIAEAIPLRLPQRACFVQPEQAPWVVVYDLESEMAAGREEEEDTVRAVCEPLCRTLRARAFAFSIAYSQCISWWVFDAGGQLMGQSVPPRDVLSITTEELHGLAGDLQLVADLARRKGVTAARIRRALLQGGPDAMHLAVEEVAERLGLALFLDRGFTDVLLLERERLQAAPKMAPPRPTPKTVEDSVDDVVYVGPARYGPTGTEMPRQPQASSLKDLLGPVPTPSFPMTEDQVLEMLFRDNADTELPKAVRQYLRDCWYSLSPAKRSGAALRERAVELIDAHIHSFVEEMQKPRSP